MTSPIPLEPDNTFGPARLSANAMIAQFLVRAECERLELFRHHLQDRIQAISPVLRDLIVHDGTDLMAAVQRFYPPAQWPWRPLDDHPIRTLGTPVGGLPSSSAAVAREDRQFMRAFASPGLIVRPVGDRSGRLGIRPVAGILGFLADVGPCVLGAFDSLVTIKLPEMVPDTVLNGLAGIRVDRVVDHPIFANRQYHLRHPVTDVRDGLPLLSFHARPIPFELPWGGAS